MQPRLPLPLRACLGLQPPHILIVWLDGRDFPQLYRCLFPVGTGERGTVGDCFDRYIVRIREMKESCRIIRQCLERLPSGPVITKVARNFKPPAGDCYVRLESARGDMGWYVVSDGTSFPYRCKIRTGSFAAISLVPKVSRNLMIADLIAVIASFDLVAPEIDR